MAELMIVFGAEPLMAARRSRQHKGAARKRDGRVGGEGDGVVGDTAADRDRARPEGERGVPKLTSSPLVVVTFPGTSVPPELVLQPCEALPVVGTAHVPPAVPKPAADPLLSQ